MKKKLVLFTIIFTAIISLKYSSGPASVNGQGYTGAPGESGTLCSSCHNAGTFGTPNTSFSVTDAMGATVTEYTAGETYQISLTATASSGTPSGYGFQLTVLDGSNADVANFSNPSSNAKVSTAASIAGGRIYAEHNGASATNTFTVDWVAPNSGTGDVTFYYAVNLVNGNGGISGDSGSDGFSTAFAETPPKVKVIGSLEINNAYTFPTSDGAANQVLATDGNGIVSWMDALPSIASNNPSSDNMQSPLKVTLETSGKQKGLEDLNTEVVLLKSEIEALKKLIEKLTTEK